jgi:hypothetical protein
MIEFPYQTVPSRPAPGSLFQWRPLIPIQITGPTGKFRRIDQALVDSGSDDTILPRGFATLIDIPLNPNPRMGVRWGGQLYPLSFGEVILTLTDGSTSLSWKTRVAFSDAPLRHPLLGQSGFLEYFDVTFLGADRIVKIAPNSACVPLP